VRGLQLGSTVESQLPAQACHPNGLLAPPTSPSPLWRFSPLLTLVSSFSPNGHLSPSDTSRQGRQMPLSQTHSMSHNLVFETFPSHSNAVSRPSTSFSPQRWHCTTPQAAFASLVLISTCIIVAASAPILTDHFLGTSKSMVWSSTPPLSRLVQHSTRTRQLVALRSVTTKLQPTLLQLPSLAFPQLYQRHHPYNGRPEDKSECRSQRHTLASTTDTGKWVSADAASIMAIHHICYSQASIKVVPRAPTTALHRGFDQHSPGHLPGHHNRHPPRAFTKASQRAFIHGHSPGHHSRAPTRPSNAGRHHKVVKTRLTTTRPTTSATRLLSTTLLCSRRCSRRCSIHQVAHSRYVFLPAAAVGVGTSRATIFALQWSLLLFLLSENPSPISLVPLFETRSTHGRQ
jgi:hypothetical protein